MLRRNLPLIIALLLCVPALFMDHYNDDWIVRATLQGVVVDGRPRRIEVTFARPLAAGSTYLLRWRNGRLEQMEPPAMNASVTLAHEPGPLGM